jgi:hypothetical protein
MASPILLTLPGLEPAAPDNPYACAENTGAGGQEAEDDPESGGEEQD